MVDRFQLLHVSDLHAAAEERRLGWPEREHLREFPEAVYRRAKAASWDATLAAVVEHQVIRQSWSDLDALLLTGDLAATGEDGDFRAARQQFVDHILGLPQANQRPALVVLPGNHDRFKPKFGLPGAYGANYPRFDEVFNDQWTEGAVRASRPMQARPAVRMEIVRNRAGRELAVVAADFTLWRLQDAGSSAAFPGKIRCRLGRGKAYSQVLTPLREVTEEAAAGGRRPVVWAIHFPPEFPHNQPEMELLNDGLVLAEAARLNVGHVFCGHTHRPFQYTLSLSAGRRVTVYCAGTATQYCAPREDGGNTVHPIEIETDNGQVTAVRWYTLTWERAQGAYHARRFQGGFESPGRVAPFNGIPVTSRVETFRERVFVPQPSGVWPVWP